MHSTKVPKNDSLNRCQGHQDLGLLQEPPCGHASRTDQIKTNNRVIHKVKHVENIQKIQPEINADEPTKSYSIYFTNSKV